MAPETCSKCQGPKLAKELMLVTAQAHSPFRALIP